MTRSNSSGTVVSGMCYDAYGLNFAAPTAGDCFRYNARWGYYYDSDLTLTLCQHRFYDPGAGRWINRDPISYSGGVNLYGYCESGPVGRIDESGRLFHSLVIYFVNAQLDNEITIGSAYGGPWAVGHSWIEIKDGLGRVTTYENTIGERAGNQHRKGGTDPDAVDAWLYARRTRKIHHAIRIPDDFVIPYLFLKCNCTDYARLIWSDNTGEIWPIGTGNGLIKSYNFVDSPLDLIFDINLANSLYGK